MAAVHGRTQELSLRGAIRVGDAIATSLERSEGDGWTPIGTEIRTEIASGAPFTFGRALGLDSEEIEHGSQLFLDGVAVFNRALGAEELVRLSFGLRTTQAHRDRGR